MRLNALSLAALPLALMSLAGAASAQQKTELAKVGRWTVMRTIDSMTDKPTCVGLLNASWDVQLSPNRMFVRIQGGIDSVTMRYGDRPASPFRLPTRTEKELRSVIIEGGEFMDAVEGGRVRYQVGTTLRGIASGDLDITGVE